MTRDDETFCCAIVCLYSLSLVMLGRVGRSGSSITYVVTVISVSHAMMLILLIYSDIMSL